VPTDEPNHEAKVRFHQANVDLGKVVDEVDGEVLDVRIPLS